MGIHATDTETTGRIWHVHKLGSAIFGGVLATFGLLGFANSLTWFSTGDAAVAGLSTNYLLSMVSVVVGAILIASAFLGRLTSARVASVVGGLFILSGLIHLPLLQTDLNILNFEMPNVIFSLVAGLLLLSLGLYGRYSGGLTDDNPYEQQQRERAERRREAAARKEKARVERLRAKRSRAAGEPYPAEDVASQGARSDADSPAAR
jgi:hypothetical protein